MNAMNATNLQEALFNQIGPTEMRKIAAMLGAETASAREVVEASIGTIIGGMARNTRDASGAASLRMALDQHIYRNPLADVLSGDVEGLKILRHVLGDPEARRVAQNMSQLTGLNANSMLKLMATVAPIVMSGLARRAADADMDAQALAVDLHHQYQTATPTALGDLLTTQPPTPESQPDALSDPLTPAGSPTHGSRTPASAGSCTPRSTTPAVTPAPEPLAPAPDPLTPTPAPTPTPTPDPRTPSSPASPPAPWDIPTDHPPAASAGSTTSWETPASSTPTPSGLHTPPDTATDPDANPNW
ncbi:DUF937 domain-containing protein [Streptosporangiaceae bacterium NEAU-GS5]|nr:DUF937 domain-containing protein [Streptosporangiaceae bacterium NEAU-GS5]